MLNQTIPNMISESDGKAGKYLSEEPHFDDAVL